MVDLSSIIGDPSVATQNIPFARGSGNPFLLPFEFAQNAAREREGRSFLQTLAGNNQLRAILAQRLAAQGSRDARFKGITSNFDKIAAELGASATGDLAGFTQGGNPFSRARDPISIVEQQGTAQTALAEATLKGVQSGFVTSQSPAQAEVTGTTLLPRETPLSVQSSVAAARVPTISGAIGAGVDLKAAAQPGDVELLRNRINNVPTSVVQTAPPDDSVTGLAGQIIPMNDAQEKSVTEVVATLSRTNADKTYTAYVRPKDRAVVVVEVDKATGQRTDVLAFDTNGGSI